VEIPATAARWNDDSTAILWALPTFPRVRCPEPIWAQRRVLLTFWAFRGSRRCPGVFATGLGDQNVQIEEIAREFPNGAVARQVRGPVWICLCDALWRVSIQDAHPYVAVYSSIDHSGDSGPVKSVSSVLNGAAWGLKLTSEGGLGHLRHGLRPGRIGT
jgi:hypothetical protein